MIHTDLERIEQNLIKENKSFPHERVVKPTLAGVEETDCNNCIYLDVTNNEWVCEIKGNIDIELEKDCKEYVRE